MTQPKDTTASSAAFSLCRKLRLQQPPLPADALIEALETLPGLQQAQLEQPHRLTLRYDTSRLRLEEVLAVLETLGVRLENSRWQRIRVSWYNYVDRNAQNNAQRTDTHCCNKPPAITKRKR